jgi:hypothetical protein
LNFELGTLHFLKALVSGHMSVDKNK